MTEPADRDEDMSVPPSPSDAMDHDEIYGDDGSIRQDYLTAIGAAIADRDVLFLREYVVRLHESELGDLLLQVLFHAAIGAERDESPFDVQDVAGALLDKLRRRAPYWFTDGPGRGHGALDAVEQDRLWQEAKAAERAGRPPRGVVEGISWDMPALALGQKVLERVRSAGIPDDLVPDRMRVVHVGAGGLFHAAAHNADEASDASDAAAHDADGSDEASDADGSGSAEVEYRRVVREFAETVSAAESRLRVPAAEASGWLVTTMPRPPFAGRFSHSNTVAARSRQPPCLESPCVTCSSFVRSTRPA